MEAALPLLVWNSWGKKLEPWQGGREGGREEGRKGRAESGGQGLRDLNPIIFTSWSSRLPRTAPTMWRVGFP